MKRKAQTCQALDGDELCGKAVVVRVMDHDEHDNPRSIYLCGEHFDEFQRGGSHMLDKWIAAGQGPDDESPVVRGRYPA